MGSPRAKIREFDITTHAELDHAFLSSLPKGTRRKSLVLGRLAADPAGLFGGDPAHELDPDEVAKKALALTEPADVVAELLAPPSGRGARIAAISILFSRAKPTQIVPVDVTIPVDTARVMVGAVSRLSAHWRPSGSPIEIFPRPGSPAGTAAKAVALLEKNGVQLDALPAADHYELAGSVSTGTVRKVRKLLKRMSAMVGPLADTMNELDEADHRALWFTLDDYDRAPFAFIVRSGMGDGMYGWDELRAGRSLVGYRCDFFGEGTDKTPARHRRPARRPPAGAVATFEDRVKAMSAESKQVELTIAAGEGKVDAVHALLAAGAKVDAAVKDAMRFCFHNKPAVMKLLKRRWP